MRAKLVLSCSPCPGDGRRLRRKRDEGQRSYPRSGPLRTTPTGSRHPGDHRPVRSSRPTSGSSWPRSVRSAQSPAPGASAAGTLPDVLAAVSLGMRIRLAIDNITDPVRPPRSSTPRSARPSPAGPQPGGGERQAGGRPQRQLDPAAGLPQGPVRQGRPGRAHHLRRDPDGGHQARRDGMAGIADRYQAGLNHPADLRVPGGRQQLPTGRPGRHHHADQQALSRHLRSMWT